VEQEFEVVIVRSYETRIKVRAASASAARQQVTDYGILEASSDYPTVGETLTVERIHHALDVMPRKTGAKS
jgi:hypothetical protein